MGRQSKYKPEYCDQILDLMGQGFSFEACCGEIGIAKNTGYEWCKTYPEFQECKDIGTARNQYWWEQQAKDGLFSTPNGEKFNAVVWIFTMKNQHNWRDKKELSGSVGVGVGDLYDGFSIEQLEGKIASILRRLPKPEAKPAAAPSTQKASKPK